jgi:hypothetical protein
LLPFVGVTLLRGRVQVGEVDFTVEIHPETKVLSIGKSMSQQRQGNPVGLLALQGGRNFLVNDRP